jgi:hypothetical protein
VDLRETINETKSPEASPWKSFHETHFNTLYFNNYNSLTAKPMALNFWEELLHLLN